MRRFNFNLSWMENSRLVILPAVNFDSFEKALIYAKNRIPRKLLGCPTGQISIETTVKASIAKR